MAVLVSVALPACGAESADPDPVSHGDAMGSVVAFDSSGVLVVRNSSPAWEPGTEWSLTPEPVLVIGALDGEEPYLFTRVEAVSRLSDGRLVVVDGIAEIRMFDEEGRHLHSFGGHGQGPAKFGSAPRVVVTPGDTLLVWDRGGSPPNAYPPGYAWFAADGSLIRTAPFKIIDPFDARYLRPMVGTHLLFADGTIVATSQLQPPREWVPDPTGSGYTVRRPVPPGEVESPELIILILSDGGTTRVEIEGDHPQGQIIRWDSGTEWNTVYPRTQVTAEGPPVRVHVSHPDKWEVRTFDETGTLIRVVEIAAPREPIAPDLIRDFDPRFTIPDSLPPIRRMLVDAEGHLWLEERSDGFRAGSGFQVIDPSGRWLGRVERPEALRSVLEIGKDHLLELTFDEWGVNRVRMYHLTRDP